MQPWPWWVNRRVVRGVMSKNDGTFVGTKLIMLNYLFCFTTGERDSLTSRLVLCCFPHLHGWLLLRQLKKMRRPLILLSGVMLQHCLWSLERWRPIFERGHCERNRSLGKDQNLQFTVFHRTRDSCCQSKTWVWLEELCREMWRFCILFAFSLVAYRNLFLIYLLAFYLLVYRKLPL